MTSTVDFHLPENLTIVNVQGLHDQLEALADEPGCDTVVLQGHDVARADTAGIQLLLAFVLSLKERDMKVDWNEPSDKLCATADILGVGGALGIH
ncbi:MAG: hypothetical protein COA42_17325 [Alteromonadaceae bacterium]|nr:MAG: hypothetical protein COA42_17325 [Alteromonadaceae bacterium]